MTGSIIKRLTEPEKLAATADKRTCQRAITDPEGMCIGYRRSISVSSPDPLFPDSLETKQLQSCFWWASILNTALHGNKYSFWTIICLRVLAARNSKGMVLVSTSLSMKVSCCSDSAQKEERWVSMSRRTMLPLYHTTLKVQDSRGGESLTPERRQHSPEKKRKMDRSRC